MRAVPIPVPGFELVSSSDQELCHDNTIVRQAREEPTTLIKEASTSKHEPTCLADSRPSTRLRVACPFHARVQEEGGRSQAASGAERPSWSCHKCIKPFPISYDRSVD
jgi:hypothetical protein